MQADRCDVLSLTCRYVALLRWDEVAAFAAANSATAPWPWAETDKQAFYDAFKAIYEANGMTKALSEDGDSLDWLCTTAGGIQSC